MRLAFLRRRRHLALIALFLVVGGILQFANANPAVSQSLVVTAYAVDEDPGLDPNAAVWKDVLGVRVPLSAQRAAYSAGGGSIATVRMQAVHYLDRVYFRVEWTDPTVDDSTTRVEDFADAVALEFPANGASSVPSICMGQADAGVNIWHWRADSQAGVKDPVSVYANTLVDEDGQDFPFFYTARDAGNPFANPELGPVQTLISQTFGALTTSPIQDVTGQGVHNGESWAVVFSRQYAGGSRDQAKFADGASTDMAVAVWNGSEDDRNGRKSVSQFVTLRLTGSGLPVEDGTNMMAVWLALLLVFGVTGIGLVLGLYGLREAGRSR